jgi:hypothetical protein
VVRQLKLYLELITVLRHRLVRKLLVSIIYLLCCSDPRSAVSDVVMIKLLQVLAPQLPCCFQIYLLCDFFEKCSDLSCMQLWSDGVDVGGGCIVGGDVLIA